VGSKRRQSVYRDKKVQGTHYITKLAAKKLRAAMTRGALPGRRATASDVITFCLERSADEFTRETAAQVQTVEA